MQLILMVNKKNNIKIIKIKIKIKNKIIFLEKIVCWGNNKKKNFSLIENERIVAISPNYETCLFVNDQNKIFYLDIVFVLLFYLKIFLFIIF